jgi:hypothetical protein
VTSRALQAGMTGHTQVVMRKSYLAMAMLWPSPGTCKTRVRYMLITEAYWGLRSLARGRDMHVVCARDLQVSKSAAG